MATSGTATFNPDVATLIEEAYERAGIEGRSGYELRSALRSLNLVFMDWANKGVNLWTLEQGEISLVAGDGQYDLPADTVDILEHSIRDSSGHDVRITRISFDSYAGIVDKTSQGRPSQIHVDRQITPRVNLWPVPDTTYTLVYWRMRRIQDAGTPDKTADVPFRFIPALVSGLAYYLHTKKSVIDPVRLAELEKQALRDWDNATYEDRERASFYMRPRIK